MTPCHRQKYDEALQGMQRYAAQMWPGVLPDWARAAMEQHAHYYATKACGEDQMRMSNYGAMAALGITRVGGDDGVVRQISMAGFGGLPQGDAPNPDHESNVNPNTGCAKSTGGTAPYSTYCGCMYGDKDRISTDKKNADDFATGSPRWACQTAAQTVGKPWNCAGVITTWLLSGGKADPLRHMSPAAKLAEYKRCTVQEWDRIKNVVEPVLPGAKAALQAAGFLPPDEGTQPNPNTGSQPNPVTGSRPIDPTVLKLRTGPFLPNPFPEKKQELPIGLIAGVGVAAVAAFFLLKK
jgi:hypothetical protein